MQDAVADDVEAEVPGLDHAGMDRPDGDLVDVRPETGTVQPRASRGVVDERRAAARGRRSARRAGRAPRARPTPRRARGRRGSARGRRRTATLESRAARPGWHDHRADAGRAVVAWRRASRSARRRRARRRSRRGSAMGACRRGGHASPRARRVGDRRAGQRERAAGEREQQRDAPTRERARPVGAAGGQRRGACPAAGRRAPRSARAQGRGSRARADDDDDRDGPGVAGLDAAERDQQLGDEERRGRQPGERAEAQAERRAPTRGSARATPARRVRRGRGLDAEQRQRGVEPERLGDRVAGDVHDDAGERERRRRSRRRARSRPCARGSSRRAAASTASGRQRNGTATASETRPKRMKTCATVRRADARGERRLDPPGDEQHARQERRGEHGRDRRGRLGVCIRQPVVHRSPADLGGEPGEDQQERDERDLVVEPRRGGAGCSRQSSPTGRRRCAARPAGARDPEQRDAEAERREDEVLPGRLERARACRE